MQTDKAFSSLNLLLDNVEGPNLLLEYFANFSRQIFSAKDFKTVLNIFYEELRRIYVNQNIEILLWHNNQRLVKFLYNEQTNQVAPVEELFEKDTLYKYIIEKRQIILTNNYTNFCENINHHTGNIPASSWLGIPMTVRGKVLGAVVVWDDNPERYLRLQDKQFLSTVTDMVSFAIENIYLYDYIVEKNGSYKIFESVLPRGTTRNSIKSVLTQLLKSVLKQHHVQYTGIFMRSRHANRWRLIDEKYENPKFSTAGIKLIEGLTHIPENLIEDTEYLFWHDNYIAHPLKNALGDALERFPVNSALFFPFVINQTYLGSWIIVFSRTEEQPSHDEVQLFRFIFYIITQLIEKRALLERKLKYETYMKHLERMKMMGELASGAAHHLNNILSVILGKAQLLFKKLEGSPYSRDLTLILKAADDGANSIRRLQNAVGQSRQQNKLKPVNINDVVQEVVEIARPRFEGEAQTRGIHYDLNLTLGKISPVAGDSAELREVMLNLINNALDAMPRGGKLTIQTTQKDNKLLIFVSDTGTGIPLDVKERIFEPFFTTKGEKGNGLGLSIAAEIIQRHRGKIYVDSIPNKGSIFMIELPCLSQKAESIAQSTELMRNLPYKILLVDDEGIVRETLAEMLEEEGCEVTTASNAEEALLKFQKYQCDIIFTDLSMPGVNGIELARRLKKINSRVPVFIITGWNQMDNTLIRSNNFIDGVIQKPFNMELIRQELERIVSVNGVNE